MLVSWHEFVGFWMGLLGVAAGSESMDVMSIAHLHASSWIADLKICL